MAEVDASPEPPLGTAALPPVGGLSPADAAEWAVQASLARRLPAALAAGFRRCNEEAVRRFDRGGSTGTLALAVGWELIVANVGDSCAYLDTGTEVLQARRQRSLGGQH